MYMYIRLSRDMDAISTNQDNQNLVPSTFFIIGPTSSVLGHNQQRHLFHTIILQ